MIRLLLLLAVATTVAVYLARLLEARRRERLAVLRAAFLVGARAPREDAAAVKTVALRSGVVRLRLPRHWSEEYHDDRHASFRDPARPERVFRMSAAEVATVPGGIVSALQAQLDGRGEATRVEDLGAGRTLLRALEVSREQGRDAVVFRWLLATAVSPAWARLGTFTFSVPERTATGPLTRDDVALLDAQVRAAHVA